MSEPPSWSNWNTAEGNCGAPACSTVRREDRNVDIERHNTDWLAAWSRKDTEALLTFYAENATYKDGQVPAGVTGHVALRNYLSGLFAATPPMAYVPETTWPIPGGYCGRWNCKFRLPNGSQRAIRGFDLVLIEDEKITYNEVYTHILPA